MANRVSYSAVSEAVWASTDGSKLLSTAQSPGLLEILCHKNMDSFSMELPQFKGYSTILSFCLPLMGYNWN